MNILLLGSSGFIGRNFKEYISYLPTYSKNTSKTPATGYYRVIVEYVSNNTYKYGTIEVFKG